MKQQFLSLIIFCSIAVHVAGQQKNTWQMSSVEARMGFSYDRYTKFDRDYVAATAVRPEELNQDLTGLSPTFGKFSVAGSLFTGVLIEKRRFTDSSFFPRAEFRIGIEIFSAREMRAGYSSSDLDTTINFCNLSNERSLELAYIKNVNQTGRKALFVGISASAGATRNNEVVIMGGSYVEYNHPSLIISRPESLFMFEGKTIYTTRAVAQLGIREQRTPRSDLSLEFRLGSGLQKIAGNDVMILPLTGGCFLGYRFYFKPRPMQPRSE